MSYDEVEIEDMAFSQDLQAFTYSCPCGDLFQITLVSMSSSERPMRTPAMPLNWNQAPAVGFIQPGGAASWGGNCSLPQLLPLHHCHLRPGTVALA